MKLVPERTKVLQEEIDSSSDESNVALPGLNVQVRLGGKELRSIDRCSNEGLSPWYLASRSSQMKDGTMVAIYDITIM